MASRAQRLVGSGVPETLGAIGRLEARLAATGREVTSAQRLRYEVFFEELSARASPEARRLRLDHDAWDEACDHLIVIDHGGASGDGAALVVGTYRLLRDDVAWRHGLDFYSAGEFDLAPLLSGQRGETRFLEVGRSCVRQGYRERRTLELLWHGLWTYARRNGISVMLGCASFEGAEPGRHAAQLAYLHRHHLAPPEWRCRPHANLAVPLDVCPGTPVDQRAARRGLPPLLRGYLRLGAFVGDGAVVDEAFATTDVLVILPVASIDPRYFTRFGEPGETLFRAAPPA